MKKTSILMAMIAFCLTVYAYDFKVDGVAYLIIGENAVEVSPSDEQANQESITIPSDVIYNGIYYNVTKIGDYAFQNSKVENFFLPKTIIEIGKSAFANCTCIETLELPDGLIKIGDRAFEGSSIKSLEIPNTVIEVGERAFSCLENLFMSFHGDLSVNFGDYTFAGSTTKRVALPKNLTSIPEGCFQDCRLLKEIAIGYGIKAIGKSAFTGCDSLLSLAIPNSSVEIDDNAFIGSTIKIIGFNFNDKPQFNTKPFNDLNTISIVTMPLESADIFKEWAGTLLEDKINVTMEICIFNPVLVYPGIFSSNNAEEYLPAGLVTSINNDIMLMADRGSDISIIFPAIYAGWEDWEYVSTINGQIIEFIDVPYFPSEEFLYFSTPLEDNFFSHLDEVVLENLNSDTAIKRCDNPSAVDTVPDESLITFDPDNETIFAPNKSIRVYYTDGRLMAHGHGSLSVASLSPGIYIVSTPGRSVKININK